MDIVYIIGNFFIYMILQIIFSFNLIILAKYNFERDQKLLAKTLTTLNYILIGLYYISYISITVILSLYKNETNVNYANIPIIVLIFFSIIFFKNNLCAWYFLSIATMLISTLTASYNIEIVNDIDISSYILFLFIFGLVSPVSLCYCMIFNRFYKDTINKIFEIGLTIINVSNPPQDDCAICLEPLSNKKSVITTCKHYFHKECIKKSSSFKESCPLCRTKIVNVNNFVSEV